MIRLLTPLVSGTVLAVTVLSVIRLVLLPESWVSSLAALLFLPIAIGLLVLQSRPASDPEKSIRVSGKLRAALVGAGVLLASSLLLSILDNSGLTTFSDGGAGGTLIAILPAIVAVAIDLLSARLERKAEAEKD